MRYAFTKSAGREIYRCTQCGCEVMHATQSSHAQIAGTYITKGSLSRIDAEHRRKIIS